MVKPGENERFVADTTKSLRSRGSQCAAISRFLRATAGFSDRRRASRLDLRREGWLHDHARRMPGRSAPGRAGCHSYFAYLRVADADSYYNDLKAKGAELLSEIKDKPWDMREFAREQSTGHRITIGHSPWREGKEKARVKRTKKH